MQNIAKFLKFGTLNSYNYRNFKYPRYDSDKQMRIFRVCVVLVRALFSHEHTVCVHMCESMTIANNIYKITIELCTIIEKM